METDFKSKIKYSLRSATKEDIKLLIKYKLSTILDYAKDLSNNELQRINNYVVNSINEEYSNYKLVIVNDRIIGCLLVSDFEDGKLLDEIFLNKDYRNKGIGSSLLKGVLKEYTKVYLWVYKDNKQAIELYKRLGFKILEETKTRYKMFYEKKRVYIALAKDFNLLYKELRKDEELVNYDIILSYEDLEYSNDKREFYKTIDIFIAEVSSEELGLGIELGFAYDEGIPIYCVYKKGIKKSYSLLTLTNNFYEYETNEQLLEIIKDIIKGLL